MDKAIKKLRKRYDSIRKSWNQTDNDELLERYLSAMTTGFDPHSDYMSPSTLDNFNITMRLELDGIGASLRATTATRSSTTSSPAGRPTRTASSSRTIRSSASAKAPTARWKTSST